MPTVIKAADREPGTQAVAFNFEDLAQHAERYLSQVRRQAAGILQEAAQQAKAIRQEARVDGLKDAQRALDERAKDQVAAQLETLLPAIRSAVDELTQSRFAWLAHWERSAVHLASAIAQRVIRRELAAEPEITLALVREALELAAGSPDIRLLVNPRDHAALGDAIHKIAAECSRLAPASVVADAGVTAGGCRVETRFGSVDQQFETQLARIQEELGP